MRQCSNQSKIQQKRESQDSLDLWIQASEGPDYEDKSKDPKNKRSEDEIFIFGFRAIFLAKYHICFFTRYQAKHRRAIHSSVSASWRDTKPTRLFLLALKESCKFFQDPLHDLLLDLELELGLWSSRSTWKEYAMESREFHALDPE